MGAPRFGARGSYCPCYPTMRRFYTVPGFLPISWRLMRKATNQLNSIPEAVYYAANKLPVYRTALRTWSLVDWCPVGERLLAEEFLYLSRKEILFRQLVELDACAIEAGVSMGYQALFTQGVLSTEPQEENLIRMLVGRVTEKLAAQVKILSRHPPGRKEAGRIPTKMQWLSSFPIICQGIHWRGGCRRCTPSWEHGAGPSRR